MRDTPIEAAVHVGTDLVMNFVKFVHTLKEESNDTSYNQLVVTGKRISSPEKKEEMLLEEKLTASPPNMFEVTLSNAQEEDSGEYVIHVCFSDLCSYTEALLYVIKGT